MFNILRYFPKSKILLNFVVIVAICVAPQSYAQSIFFDPPDTFPTDPDFDVAINIDCNLESVKGIELSVTYDPSLVQLNSITAGAWYSDSGQSYYFFDYTNIDPPGTIHFASAVLDGALGGSDALAVCHFSIVGIGVSPLEFQEVDVRDPANIQLIFGNSIGDKITIDPAVKETVFKFGSVKAIYR